MNDLDLFFDISRDAAMATYFGKNGKLRTFVAQAFRNGMGYRYLNVRINCTNMPVYRVKISWNLVQ